MLSPFKYAQWNKSPVMTADANRRMLEQLVLRRNLPVRLTVQLDLGELSTRARNAIKRALKAGFMDSYSGVAAQVYEVLCKAHGLPCVMARTRNAKSWQTAAVVLYFRGGADLDNKPLTELLHADRVAARLQGISIVPKSDSGIDIAWNTSGFAVQRLFAMCEHETITETMKTRYTPEMLQQVERVVHQLDAGEVITFNY
jgi:hypothetical protein